jgi:hypothetical protein
MNALELVYRLNPFEKDAGVWGTMQRVGGREWVDVESGGL